VRRRAGDRAAEADGLSRTRRVGFHPGAGRLSQIPRSGVLARDGPRQGRQRQGGHGDGFHSPGNLDRRPARRLCWAVVGSPRLTHHNASLQVFGDGERRSRVVWIADLLPDEMAGTIRAMLEQGMAVMKKTLER
jgi:hypothetical protein